MSTPLQLIPDAPITNPSFDRLDRMSFVRSFAEAIRAAKGADSVVLALAGPWGSGKSSLLNLVAGELTSREDGLQPLVMRFNPWWFSGTEKLVAAFLQQLAAALGRPQVRESLGSATPALANLAEAIARPGLQTTDDAAARDIEVLRHRVSEILERSDRRILIFMDDIDRLTPDEMTQLLLIVRSVADFPNVTYVLAFDYDVVCDAIGNKLGVDGRTYLEKVVQLQIDVPIPSRMTLERMVIGQLESIDPAAKGLDPEAQVYFRMLFEGGIKHFLTTPRACTRLLNVIRFTYPTLAGQVFFPDMLGISCLMAFSSQSIQAIRSSSEAFVGHCETSGSGWRRIRKFHSSWLSEIPRRDRAAVESIVRLVFPKVAWALNGPRRGEEFVPVWRKQKRICSVEHFDSYFRLGLTAGEAAEYEWQTMVELLDDATAFDRAVQRFGPLEGGQGAEWVGELLQQASRFVNEKATAEQAANFFRAIMRRGDQIAAVQEVDDTHSLAIEPIHGAVSVLLACLIRMEDPLKRFDILAASVAEDAGLLTAAELLDLLHYRADLLSEATEPPTAEGNASRLRKIIRVLDKRIQRAAESGELAAHPQFMRVVRKWRQFGRKTGPRAWIRETCSSDERLVEALLQLRSGGELDVANGLLEPAEAFPVKVLTDLFDRDDLRDRTAKLLRKQPDWLNDDGVATLHLLQNILS